MAIRPLIDSCQYLVLYFFTFNRQEVAISRAAVRSREISSSGRVWILYEMVAGVVNNEGNLRFVWYIGTVDGGICKQINTSKEPIRQGTVI